MSDHEFKPLEGSNDIEKLHDLCQRPYKEQAVWFLNGFWEDFENEPEQFFKFVETCAELDEENGKEGFALNDFAGHRFLEVLEQTLTYRELRAAMDGHGVPKQRSLPLIHFLMIKFSHSPSEVVNASQGDNSEELAHAQQLLDEVQALVAACTEAAENARSAEASAKAAEKDAIAQEDAARTAEAHAIEQEDAAKTAEAHAIEQEDAAKAAEAEAIAREEEATAAEEAAHEAEAPFKAAQEELNAALAELHAQEEAFNSKKQELEAKSEEGGVVSRNKAKNELAQMLSEDPLPLRQAKITTEAAERKADKVRKPFKIAREAAEQAAAIASDAREAASAAAAEAEASRQAASAAAESATASREAASAAAAEAQAARAEADAALDEANAKFDEAVAYMEEVKSKPGQPLGAIWFLDRELEEAKKFMPTRIKARAGVGF
eukprot:TRINITY_DN68_c0_g1_i2.p1 TRINITY_DN68_c0_g1~~TRINITY_DN68_c0_g1_i2.p1  ORF type:complete len:448 (+),score=165.19 TRINITY_DN68_c0_g1_i2:39-1346(+)